MTSDIFNADERAGARESRPIIIGGRKFLPLRKTRRRSAGITVLADQSQKLIETIGETDRISPETSDHFNELIFKQIRLMLGYADSEPWKYEVERLDDQGMPLLSADGQPLTDTYRLGPKGEPPLEFLNEELDIEEAPRILAFLMGQDPDEVLEPRDPTPPTDVTTTPTDDTSTPEETSTPTNEESPESSASAEESSSPSTVLSPNGDGSYSLAPSS